jgi:iron complex transport system ATP-binding protein
MTSTSPPRLQAAGLGLGYDGRPVVHEVDLVIPDHGITTIIGPNGCGKSTLLRGLGRLLAPRTGHVLLDGKQIDRLPARAVATSLGLLPQAPTAPDGLTVAELVSRGRHPHQRWFRQWSQADETAVADALRWTGMTEFAERAVDTLSGGQRQRAWISMALAQGTGVLLLDEPTTYLDLAHAIDVLDLIDRLHEEEGRTVVLVLHDLNLAARYSDHLVVMAQGRVAAQGAPADVLTEELLAATFGLGCRVLTDPVSGRPMVVPIGTRHVLAPQPAPV